MHAIALFCKSYRDDVLRARRLLESVQRFNADRLPAYVSVPAADAALFKERCAGLAFELLTDEEILAANPALDRAAYAQLPGYQTQQVVKAEFWRLGKAENYLCLDSDSYFLRPFGTRDFLALDGTPYTVMHESKELLQFAALSGMDKIARHRAEGCAQGMALFGREGRCWDFGPVPVVWSARVWRDLDERYLRPRGMSFSNCSQDESGCGGATNLMFWTLAQSSRGLLTPQQQRLLLRPRERPALMGRSARWRPGSCPRPDQPGPGCSRSPAG